MKQERRKNGKEIDISREAGRQILNGWYTILTTSWLNTAKEEIMITQRGRRLSVIDQPQVQQGYPLAFPDEWMYR